MKFENIEVMNFKNALRGMRNPKNSWNLSDSAFGIGALEWCEQDYEVAREWAMQEIDQSLIDLEEKEEKLYGLTEEYDLWLVCNGIIKQSDESVEYAFDECVEYAFIGPKDMKLAQTLIKAGPEHRKFMRQIFVSVDITAPLYW